MKIAEAAFNLVEESGVEALTFDAVGAKLGIKSSHIAYYFRSKRELIHAVLQIVVMGVQRHYVEKISLKKTPEDQLKAYVSAAFLGMIEHPTMMKNIALLFFSASSDLESRNLYTSAKEAGIKRLGAVLARLDRLRTLDERSIQKLAEDILVMLHGRILQCIIYRDVALIHKFERQSQEDVARMIDPK